MNTKRVIYFIIALAAFFALCGAINDFARGLIGFGTFSARGCLFGALAGYSAIKWAKEAGVYEED